ncbi:MAG: hypothetical protein H6555_02230 [Lewinellaceae bacterium]|nr:hypothetical protein [Lewinellaceae bacterium]
MKNKVHGYLRGIILLILIAVTFMSQYEAPSGTNYENRCVSPVPFTENGTATAYYNDPDGDCISTEWEIYYDWGDGMTTIFTDERWMAENPGSDGSYDFNGTNWGCCNLPATAGSDGTVAPDPDSTCPCDWYYDAQRNEFVFSCTTPC